MCPGCLPAFAYADDTTIAVGARSNDVLQMTLNRSLEAFEGYLVANGMAINKGKTEVLRMGYRLGPADSDTLKLDAVDSEGEQITTKENCKLLGVTLSRNLSWEDHLKSSKAALHTRLKKRLGALRLIGKYICKDKQNILANGLINSIIVYAIQVWGPNCSKKLIRQTQTLQSQAARWALGVNWRASTEKSLREVKWLSVNQLIGYHALLLLWKSVRGVSLLERNVNWAVSRTQGRDRIMQEPYKMEFKRKTWRPTAIALWNKLPEKLRTETRLSHFKGGLRTWISDCVVRKL